MSVNRKNIPLSMLKLILSLLMLVIPNLLFAQNAEEPTELQSYFALLEEEQLPVTTGASRPMPKRKMPATVTVVTAEEIKLLGLRNVTDVINYIVPGGIADIHRGDKSGLYSFRGIAAEENAKYIFMVDGLNCNSMTAKGAFTETYLGLLDDLDRIEITQGVSSTLYGDGATSGIINFITKTGNSFQGTEVTSGYGSNDKFVETVKYGRKKSETENDFYYFGFTRSDGSTPRGGGGVYTTSNYSSEHAASGRHWDHFEPSVKFHSNNRWGDLTLRMRYVHEVFEEPYLWSINKSGSTTQYDEAADRFIGHNYFFIQPEIKHKFNDRHSIKANLSLGMDERWEEKIHDWYSGAGGTLIVKSGEEILAYGERKIRGQFFHYYDGWENHKFTSGAEAFWMLIGPDFYGDNKKIGKSGSTRTRRNSKEKEILYSGAVFFEDIWQITPQDTFFAGVRFENHNLTPFSISPRAALSHDLSEQTNIKILYNSGYRIPPWTDYTQNESANYSKPEPEKVESYEAHLLHKFSPKLSGTLIGYYTIYKDLLNYWGGSSGGPGAKYNFPEVRAAGIEGLGEYRIDRLVLKVSHSFSRPVHFADSANAYEAAQLSYNLHEWSLFPTHLTKAQAIVHLVENKCMLGLTYMHPWGIRGQRNADPDLKKGADYLNATLTLKLKENMEFQLSGYNLTGEDHPWWGSNTKDGVSRAINPHTEYFVKLIWRF
jgi:iron complex outermembrane receptor protein